MKDSYYRVNECFLICFDLTDLKTLDELEYEVEHILRFQDDDNVPILLVGTKCDLIKEEEIDFKKIDTYTKKNNILFIKTSAKDNVNIDETFIMLIHRMKHLKESPIVQDTIVHQPKEKLKNSKCEMM